MNPFNTTTPRHLQPETESLIKILAILNSTIENGKIKVFAPSGVSISWGNIIGMIESQTDLTSYVQTQISAALSTVVEKKGGIDCSANPNFPAASNCDLYFVTHAGKIGGPSGQGVSIGDTMIAIADTAAGDQAAVGANWIVLNTNIPGLSTLGIVFATMLTPAGPRYLRVNSDGTISSLTDVDLKSSIGLGNVDNTSDANKPVSTAQAAAIAAVNKSSIGLAVWSQPSSNRHL